MTTDQMERPKQDAASAAAPKPDAALKRLDRLVGEWEMRGHPLGSDEETITGTTRFSWLDEGFFLLQEMRWITMGSRSKAMS